MRRALMAAVTAAVVALPGVAQARDDFNSKPFRQKVTVANMLVHERALQRFADANGGTRAAGTPGNTATTDYVLKTMRAAGWNARLQPFEFPFFQETGPATFAQTTPTAATFTEDTDYFVMTYSGSGDATAPVFPVDVTVPMDPAAPASTSNSGCEAADFAGLPQGTIALVQRGTCTFGAKAQNAEAAGASAIVVFNEGQPGRTTRCRARSARRSAFRPSASSYQLGADAVTAIRGGATVTWHISTSTISENRITNNVIADSPFGDPDRTVVVSAHNDSVLAGPGINDDGSGTSMDLELARNLGKAGRHAAQPRALPVGRRRGAGPARLAVLRRLAERRRARADHRDARLRHGRLAELRAAGVRRRRLDVRAGRRPGRTAPGFIESLFTRWFDGRGQAHEPIPFDGRSDYVRVHQRGHPRRRRVHRRRGRQDRAGAALFGGIAGEPLDPCYHQACDTIDNLNLTVFGADEGRRGRRAVPAGA